MNVEDLTIKQARELAAMFPTLDREPIPHHPYPVGEAVYIRTVTMHYTGRLVRVTAGELVLTDAAWIASSGRWAVALAEGTLDEVEPYPAGEVVVSRGSVLDVCRWNHPLPRTTK